MELLRFRGMSIDKEEFEEKYGVQLSKYEWSHLVNLVSSSWDQSIDEVRLLAFKHIRDSMGKLGYKIHLDQTKIQFEKKEDS